LTKIEQEMAEQEHQLVLDFLHCKRLPMDDFYDVVIFGYLSAVQQYIRNPPAGVCFKAMAFRAMKDSVLQERAHNARPMRSVCTVSMNDKDCMIADPEDIVQRVERKELFHQATSVATPSEARIISLLADGFALHEAARALKLPKKAVQSCLDEFCCRARSAIV